MNKKVENVNQAWSKMIYFFDDAFVAITHQWRHVRWTNKTWDGGSRGDMGEGGLDNGWTYDDRLHYAVATIE